MGEINQNPDVQNQRTKGNMAWKTFNVGTGVLDSGMFFMNRRSEHPNENLAVTTGLTAGYTAAWVYAPHVMWAYQLASGAGALGQVMRQGARDHAANQIQMGQPNFGGNFQDTQLAATSRQRGLQAIQNSRLNARNAMTNQARSLHRF